MSEQATPLKRTDYATDAEVRWCPGCGDYAILASLQRVFAELQVKRENTVFISGIGCSGRLPYYMNTYGFHTIHGRAPAIATGLKLTRPELDVWIVTGDGDGLSIGVGHLYHLLRRNVDVKVLLLNNRIYGLTKGQSSPTSEMGKVTATSPTGTQAMPVNPCHFAVQAGASFVARAIDVDGPGLQAVLEAAQNHKGSAFVEILQNCNIYNDHAFQAVSDKTTRAQHSVLCRDGEPLLFGSENEKAIIQSGFSLSVSAACSEAIIHDVRQAEPHYVALLSALSAPVALGIFRQVSQPIFTGQISSDPVDLQQVLEQGTLVID